PEIIINETPVYYLSVDFIDIDADGDKDILYLSNNARYIAWLENLDGLGNFGPEQIIKEEDVIQTVILTDMDNDGDLDMVASITNTFSGWIVWYENLDGQGNFGEENLLIQNGNEFTKILIEDIDNDGLLDILATDLVLNSGSIFWYKNLGDETFGAQQIIYQFLYVQSGGTNISEFHFIDINTDGKKDIAMTSYDENFNYTTHWLENLDNQGNFGDLNFIMNSDDQYLLYDLDNDNDNDILLWNPYTDKITWKENEDGQGVFGTPTTITTSVDFPRDAKASDADGDNWLDIITAFFADNKLAWYKNNSFGIYENEIANYQIYPNPTSGVIHVETKLPISQISIYTLLGQIIEKKQNTNQVDLSTAKTGVYLLT